MDRIRNIVNRISDVDTKWLLIGIFVLGIFVGFLLDSDSGAVVNSAETDKEGTNVHDVKDHQESKIWTCSMHPQIKQPKFGKCPLCGMDLIPVDSGGEELGERELILSANAIKLADIQTGHVNRKEVFKKIRMAGKVKYDETRVKYITSRIEGRIDKLYVGFVGERVRKGEPLVRIYSPELITAQQELIQLAKSYKKIKSEELGLNKKISRSAFLTVREKLKLWGLSENQIRKIENSEKAENYLILHSPISGVVVHMNVVEGVYVKTGTEMYKIVDLSKVWIKLDAYESDLPWIRKGQNVEFKIKAFQGEIFNGVISFIDPILNPKTRTVKVRANLNNAENKLKPEMFVKAVLKSRLSSSGKVVDLKSEHGVIGKRKEDIPLVIPSSAPLITGTRAVVYVAVNGKDGVFEGREIILGPKAGDFYIVKNGLTEGEVIVVNGAFKIDSDLQIKAKISMMNPKEGGIFQFSDEDISDDFRVSVDKVTSEYFSLSDALSIDSIENAKGASEQLIKKLSFVKTGLLSNEQKKEWVKTEKEVVIGINKVIKAKSIDKMRKGFESVTEPIQILLRFYGNREKLYYKFNCTMAFNNKGAFWIQLDTNARNPYFGKSMSECSASMEKISPVNKMNRM